jgi:hypothetical protein
LKKMHSVSADDATLRGGLSATDVSRPPWWRARRGLLLALALSAVVHLVVSLAPQPLPAPRDATPLAVSVKELPPPPTPAAATPRPPTPKARPRPPRSAPATPPAPLEAPREPDVAPPTLESDAVATEEAAVDGESATTAEPVPPPVLAEEMPTPEAPPIPAKALPPRVDLAYKVFFGTQAFHVGSATYRFEHAAGTYRVHTIAEAHGLAALFVRGQGRVESRGVINGEGLQPLELVVDKFNKRGTERASFDWEIGIATLHEGKTEPIELPTFDPLTLIWQFYFKPPTAESHSFAIATTRRVNRVTVTRVRTETIEWTHGPVEAEVWHRTSEDGRTEAYVWLAPALHYIPVKIRTEHATRGTLIALLDAIQIDAPGTTATQ